MKFSLSFFFICHFIINSVQNVPVFHPSHLGTVRLHLTTVRSIFVQDTTEISATSPVMSFLLRNILGGIGVAKLNLRLERILQAQRQLIITRHGGPTQTQRETSFVVYLCI